MDLPPVEHWIARRFVEHDPPKQVFRLMPNVGLAPIAARDELLAAADDYDRLVAILTPTEMDVEAITEAPRGERFGGGFSADARKRETDLLRQAYRLDHSAVEHIRAALAEFTDATGPTS